MVEMKRLTGTQRRSEPLPTAIQKLEVRIGNRFDWHYRRIVAGGVRRPFAVATSPDELLADAVRRQEQGEPDVEDPYWATDWQAAVGLDQFLDRFDLQNQSVLELGAGTGRAGIAAAVRGAHVTITDGIPDPMLLARLSTWDLPHCRVRQLRWGQQQLGRSFDFILGSDVTYNRSLWELLETAIRQHAHQKTLILLTDPVRLISTQFRDWIIDRDWQYNETFVPHSQDPQRSIRIMQIRMPPDR